MKRELQKCAMPDCENPAMSVGGRGKNSTVIAIGGDKSKRSKWCRYHRRGGGKSDRLQYALEQANKTEAS